MKRLLALGFTLCLTLAAHAQSGVCLLYTSTGYHGPAVDKARAYIASHLDSHPDAYTLAVLANFAVADNKDRDLTARIFQMLLDARTETADKVSWSAEETGVYSTGSSATIETTGLAAQALLKWGPVSYTHLLTMSIILSATTVPCRRKTTHMG